MRRPAWATAGFGVSVNGQPQPTTGEPGAYLALEREWRDRDVVELRLPMPLRAEPMPDDASIVAFLQGPIVLAADLGSAPDTAKRIGPSAPELRADESVRMPALVAATASDALGTLQPTGEPLTFRSRILEQEHRIYAEAVSLFAQGRLRVEGRRVRILPR